MPVAEPLSLTGDGVEFLRALMNWALNPWSAMSDKGMSGTRVELLPGAWRRPGPEGLPAGAGCGRFLCTHSLLRDDRQIEGAYASRQAHGGLAKTVYARMQKVYRGRFSSVSSFSR